jgi:N-acylneuraminate cytidylyltransferase
VNIAIIPARGGSKRIFKKNIRNFCGKPIISYSIQAAIDSKLFDHVIVSTDDYKIATEAKSLGAEVPFMRPDYLSDDFTGTSAVVKHAIQWVEENWQLVDYACCIYATAPFIQVDHLKKGIECLIESDKSFAFTVTTFPFAIQRAIKIDIDGNINPFNKDDIRKRSQDLEEAYHDAGQFYWGTKTAFLEDCQLFSSKSVPIILPRSFVQDIDTEEDWKQAELMYQTLFQIDK